MIAPYYKPEDGNLSSMASSYIHKIKEIKTGGVHIETAGFNHTADEMEKEISSLRNLYERKIQECQTQLHDINSNISECGFHKASITRSIDNLKQQIQLQANRNTAVEQHKSALKDAIERKENAIRQNKLQMERQQTEEARCTSASQLKKALDENCDMKRRLEDISHHNTEFESKIRLLENQLELNTQTANQQVTLLKENLATASDTVTQLENELATSSVPTEFKALALRDLTSATRDCERQLTECKFNTNLAANNKLSELKTKIEKDRKLFEVARAENTRLTDCIEELNLEIRKLQGELILEEQANRAAEESLVIVKDSIAKQVQEVKSKLNDCQHKLISTVADLRSSEQLPAANVIDLPYYSMYEQDIKKPVLSTQNGDYSKFAPVFSDEASQSSELCSPLPTIDYAQFNPSEKHEPPTGYEVLIPEEHTNLSCRAQSAPAGGSAKVILNKQHRVPSKELGKGRSYFRELFEQKPGYERVYSASQRAATRSCLSGKLPNSMPKSSLGSLTIHEVSPDGRYAILYNSSGSTDIELGKYSIRQNVSGIPVSRFTFPDRLTFRAGSFITVFSGLCSAELHQPPNQFVRLEKERWGTGPECTTVLCNSKGKAVAWINAPHKHSSGHEDPSPSSSVINATVLPGSTSHTHSNKGAVSESENSHPLYLKSNERNCAKVEPNAAKAIRPKSSLMSKRFTERRQLHSASGHRMGSAPMRKYTPTLS